LGLLVDGDFLFSKRSATMRSQFSISFRQVVRWNSTELFVSILIGVLTSIGGTESVQAQGVPPTILNQPVDRTNNAGTSASFTVSADGDGPLKYQWRKNDSPLAGATT